VFREGKRAGQDSPKAAKTAVRGEKRQSEKMREQNMRLFPQPGKPRRLRFSLGYEFFRNLFSRAV
jgi:hypothetical protein